MPPAPLLVLLDVAYMSVYVSGLLGLTGSNSGFFSSPVNWLDSWFIPLRFSLSTTTLPTARTRTLGLIVVSLAMPYVFSVTYVVCNIQRIVIPPYAARMRDAKLDSLSSPTSRVREPNLDSGNLVALAARPGREGFRFGLFVLFCFLSGRAYVCFADHGCGTVLRSLHKRKSSGRTSFAGPGRTESGEQQRVQ